MPNASLFENDSIYFWYARFVHLKDRFIEYRQIYIYIVNVAYIDIIYAYLFLNSQNQ
jgi:hypothetical protein